MQNKREIVNWDKTVARTLFIVSKTEVIFFIDAEHTIWCFIAFPEKEIVVEYHRASTTDKAKSMLSLINIRDARDYYYREKKGVE